MAPSIKFFVQVALLCCIVTTSMGSITDWEQAFLQLENKVNVQQEEIKSSWWNSSISALYGTLHLWDDGVPTFTLWWRENI